MPPSAELQNIAATLQQCQDDLKASSNGLTSSLLNLLASPLYIINGEGIVEYVNQSAAKSLKSKVEQIIGKTLFQIMPYDVAERRWVTILQGLEKQDAFAFLDSRQSHYFINNIFCLQREHGKLKKILVYSREITDTVILAETLKNANLELEQRIQARTAELIKANQELKEVLLLKERAEEELKVSEKRYRNLIEASPFGTMQIDMDGKILFCNEQAAALLGYARSDELLHKSFAEIASPLQQIEVFNELLQSYDQHLRLNKDLIFRKADETRLPVRSGISLLSGADEEPTGMMVIFYDSSSQYFAEQRIRNNLRLAQALANAATLASTATNLQSALNGICEHACKALTAPAAIIRLYNPQQDTLEAAGWYGLDETHIQTYYSIPRAPLLDLTRLNGPRVVVSELDNLPPNPSDSLIYRPQLQYSLIGNMMRHDNYIGVLVVLIPKDHSPIEEEEKLFVQALAEQASITVERYRLAEHQEMRALELEGLVQASIDLRKAQSKNEMASALLKGFQLIFSANCGAVFLTDEGQLTLHDQFGTRTQPPQVFPIPSAYPFFSTLQEGHSVFLENVEQYADILHQPCFEGILLNTRAAIFMPLRYHQEINGFIILGFFSPQKFTQDVEHIVALYQEIADGAMQRVESLENLENVVRSRTHELRVLYEITALLNAPLGFEETLKSALGRILDFSKALAITIHIADFHTQQLSLVAHIGIPSTMMNILQSNNPFPFLWEKVFSTDKPRYLEDITSTLSPEIISAYPHRISYFGLPIRSRGSLLGVLSIFGHENHPFTINDQVILLAIADQLGVAAERARLTAQAEEAVKLEERQRLARDLHDALSQSLYSLSLLSKAYQRSLPDSSPLEVQQWLAELNAISQDAMKELRLLLYELRPAAIEQDGLQGAIRRRLEAVEKRALIHTQLDLRGSYRLPPPVEEQLYRIAQEALNNALQHAHHKTLNISITSTPDQFEMVITDDGIGFEVAKTLQETQGMGLSNIINRARQIDAMLTIHSKPGEGTTIKINKGNQHGKSAEDTHRR
ncbi:MAG: GAF domain-containing protein [Chloroflexota bacterium]